MAILLKNDVISKDNNDNSWIHSSTQFKAAATVTEFYLLALAFLMLAYMCVCSYVSTHSQIYL